MSKTKWKEKDRSKIFSSQLNFFRINFELNLLTFIHLRLSLCIEYSTRFKYLTNAYPNNSFPSEA